MNQTTILTVAFSCLVFTILGIEIVHRVRTAQAHRAIVVKRLKDVCDE